MSNVFVLKVVFCYYLMINNLEYSKINCLLVNIIIFNVSFILGKY